MQKLIIEATVMERDDDDPEDIEPILKELDGMEFTVKIPRKYLSPASVKLKAWPAR